MSYPLLKYAVEYFEVEPVSVVSAWHFTLVEICIRLLSFFIFVCLLSVRGHVPKRFFKQRNFISVSGMALTAVAILYLSQTTFHLAFPNSSEIQRMLFERWWLMVVFAGPWLVFGAFLLRSTSESNAEITD